MKAYLCSIGESTEQVCRTQLERFGFEVILLNEKEPWIDKYTKFLNMASEDCIRIDADIVPNKHIKVFENCGAFIAKAQLYDIYRNEIWPLAPIYYSKEALEKIRNTSWAVDIDRPETGVWRLFQKRTLRINVVVGVHGFWQSKEDNKRVLKNKSGKTDYELDFVKEVYKL